MNAQKNADFGPFTNGVDQVVELPPKHQREYLRNTMKEMRRVLELKGADIDRRIFELEAERREVLSLLNDLSGADDNLVVPEPELAPDAEALWQLA